MKLMHYFVFSVFVQLFDRVAATLIVESFNYKFNQKYLIVKPVVTQVDNSTIEFKAEFKYLEEFAKMMVKVFYLSVSIIFTKGRD